MCSSNMIRIISLCLLSSPLSPAGSARASQHIMELPERLRSSPPVTLALSINRAFLERNPVRLLRLARRLNFMQSCALHRHLVACRRDLLLIYSHGHNSRNCRFPLDTLAQLLSLDTSPAARLCQAYGLEVNQDNQVVFSKAGFAEPTQGDLHCNLYHNIVAEKQRDLTIKNIIHGCAWDKCKEQISNTANVRLYFYCKGNDRVAFVTVLSCDLIFLFFVFCIWASWLPSGTPNSQYVFRMNFFRLYMFNRRVGVVAKLRVCRAHFHSWLWMCSFIVMHLLHDLL